MKALCPLCHKRVSITKDNRFWEHKTGQGDRCGTAATMLPGSDNIAPPLPGADDYTERMAAVVNDSNGWDDFMGGGGRNEEATIPMTQLGQEIVQRYKEIFYSYGNRRSSDNRNAQETLGPSEIGARCDRRLVMSLLRRPPVNPGSDGWAAFVGTAVHVSLADMFEWANGNSGRFATEVPLSFQSDVVPRGTSDVLDRVLNVAADHKLMGAFSLKKLRTKGPSETYRTQVHVYAYGQRLKGEKVDHVAIIAWPRTGSDLSDMYVWTEKYDPMIAKRAFDRVEGMAANIEAWREGTGGTEALRSGGLDDVTIARMANVDPSECTYCSFHLKHSTDLKDGCNGKP